MSDRFPDIQNEVDNRKIDIDMVGIKNILYPIKVYDKKNKFQSTIATIDMSVNLPHNFRGTHMSRFIEVLNEYRELINGSNMDEILRRIRRKLNASSAHMLVKFTYFTEKVAPVSKIKSLMDYNCKFIASDVEDDYRFILAVKVPITTLCPCSKEISKKGAHNQRSIVTVQVQWEGELVWIEEIIDLVESSASSPIFSLLKREDEKFVTETAYENPRFVEDVVREVSIKLMGLANIVWFRVESLNHESIHNHDAYAVKEWHRKKQ